MDHFNGGFFLSHTIVPPCSHYPSPAAKGGGEDMGAMADRRGGKIYDRVEILHDGLLFLCSSALFLDFCGLLFYPRDSVPAVTLGLIHFTPRRG